MDRFLSDSLDAYRSGELDEVRRRKLEERLARDPAARAEFDRLVSVSDLFKTLECRPGEVDPPVDLGPRIMASVREHGSLAAASPALAGRESKKEAEERIYEWIRSLFRTLALPAGAPTEPSLGFQQRVLRRIREESKPALWDWLLQPFVIRRVAVVSCAWLFLLVSGTMSRTSAQPSASSAARAVLVEPPESADYCNVRLGSDLEVNRSSMLAAVMVNGGAAR